MLRPGPDLVEMERASQVLASYILRHCDLPRTLIAGNDLLSPSCYFILAERPARVGQASKSTLHVICTSRKTFSARFARAQQLCR